MNNEVKGHKIFYIYIKNNNQKVNNKINTIYNMKMSLNKYYSLMDIPSYA